MMRVFSLLFLLVPTCTAKLPPILNKETIAEQMAAFEAHQTASTNLEPPSRHLQDTPDFTCTFDAMVAGTCDLATYCNAFGFFLSGIVITCSGDGQGEFTINQDLGETCFDGYLSNLIVESFVPGGYCSTTAITFSFATGGILTSIFSETGIAQPVTGSVTQTQNAVLCPPEAPLEEAVGVWGDRKSVV